MKTKSSETRYKRVWFGAVAKVTIGPGFLHRTGFGRLAIPHPPVANRLLRLGLSVDMSRKLIFAHEFAHFQTAPALFAYILGMLVFSYAKGRIGIGEIFLVLAGIQSAWEIMSEGLVLLEDSAAYYTAYKGVTRFPRLLFWAAGGTLAAAGWAAVLLG